jgi:hypothetical protein
MSVQSPTKSIFPKSFKTILVSQTLDTTIFRSALTTLEDVEKWKKKYSEITRSEWIVQYERSQQERLINSYVK